MTVRLSPMHPDHLPGWLDRTNAEYVAGRIAAGESPEVAQRNLEDNMRLLFPGGTLKAGHAVFDVIHDAEGNVGFLWIGPDTSEDPGSWWVWDIEVSAEHRGRGMGRDAMILGEDYARANGARTLGLNVFGFNTTARALYESLGYQATAIQMKKDL